MVEVALSVPLLANLSGAFAMALDTLGSDDDLNESLVIGLNFLLDLE